MVDPAVVLRALGGTATYEQLLAHTTRRALRSALSRGSVVRATRDRYCLPDQGGEQRRLALEAGGVLSHLSAAEHHGWGIVRRPTLPALTMPRHSSRPRLTTADQHWGLLSDAERVSGVTAPLRTVIDCARTLPVHEGLAVADSALRAGAVSLAELQTAAAECRSPGAARARTVCAHADGRAANAFESALRGHLVDAGITSFEPQYVIAEPGLFAVVDLADDTARVASEADGHAVHGTRRAFAEDLQRHDELQTAGWVTRRFAWEHVMWRPVWVVAQVRAALGERPPARKTRRKRPPRSRAA